jgi:Flp pilus assembly protein TadG
MTRTRVSSLFGRDGDSGTAAIEFALMTPFLLLLLGGVTEFGFAMYEEMQVNAAVEAGVMYATANAPNIASSQTLQGYALTPAIGQPYCGCPNAAGSVSNLGNAPCSGSPYTTACSGGTAAGKYVQVTASINHLVILPTTFGLPSSFSAKAVVRVN